MSIFDIVYVTVACILALGLGCLLMVMWLVCRDQPAKSPRTAPDRSSARYAAAVRPSLFESGRTQ